LPAFSADTSTSSSGASFLRAGGGSGTVADPYILRDVYGLQGIGTSPALLAGNWRLGNAIDASGTSGWQPSFFVGSNFETGFDPIASRSREVSTARASRSSGLFISKRGCCDDQQHRNRWAGVRTSRCRA
jgi:hypothetical protein